MNPEQEKLYNKVLEVETDLKNLKTVLKPVLDSLADEKAHLLAREAEATAAAAEKENDPTSTQGQQPT